MFISTRRNSSINCSCHHCNCSCLHHNFSCPHCNSMCSLQFHAFTTTPHIAHNFNYNLFLVLAKNLKLTTFFFLTTYFSLENSLIFFFHTQGLTWTIMSTSFKVACKLTSMFWHKTIWLGIKLWLDFGASCNQNGPSLFQTQHLVSCCQLQSNVIGPQ